MLCARAVYVRLMIRALAYFLTLFAFAAMLSACGAADPDVQAKIDAARARNDGPPIWKASHQDSVLYIYGTLHLLPADLDWQRSDMRSAFDAAGTVFFETSQDEAAVSRAQVITAADGYYSSGETLTRRLNGYEQKLLFAATLNAGLKDGALDKMQPWLAADTLSFAELSASGITAENGADSYLLDQAKARGKNIRYLEDMDAHLAATRVLPQHVQLEALREAMQSAGDLTEKTNTLITEWARGNTHYIQTDITEPLKQRSPEYYEALFTKRNAAWALSFDEFLKSGESGFAAVGVGHLVGPDSLIQMMQDNGYKVERYYAYRGDNVIKTIDLYQ